MRLLQNLQLLRLHPPGLGVVLLELLERSHVRLCLRSRLLELSLELDMSLCVAGLSLLLGLLLLSLYLERLLVRLHQTL